MTTFSDIYANARGYRDDFLKLNNLVQQLSSEKAKGDPLVSWFRLRDRRVNEVLEPMQIELRNRIKKLEREMNEDEANIELLNKARNAIANDNMELANRITRDFDVEIAKNSDEAYVQLGSLQKVIEKRKIICSDDILRCKECMKDTRRAKTTFLSARRTKEIDRASFSVAIRSINDWRSSLDIDVPELKELPESYDVANVSSLHEQIRATVGNIDSRYKMKIFASPIRTVRTIIHDVGNDRGKKAFANRSNELLSNVNESIDIFNKKYWQITGSRWERIGTNQHGYRLVPPTHTEIPKI
ncbi:hypothetical protein [Listeria booriae]|uniref:Uncharacterized protein n=1 Tax=Listeria booriae TaxID=1552123 RepID=A0A842EWE9_9LIST|nr:hypothetical protein [Listeria booriae]MBC2242407.1 hypothetical protein [Listeria booriae]